MRVDGELGLLDAPLQSALLLLEGIFSVDRVGFGGGALGTTRGLHLNVGVNVLLVEGIVFLTLAYEIIDEVLYESHVDCGCLGMGGVGCGGCGAAYGREGVFLENESELASERAMGGGFKLVLNR